MASPQELQQLRNNFIDALARSMEEGAVWLDNGGKALSMANRDLAMSIQDLSDALEENDS